jgi:bifunctional non-homologous end joining protein LigD
MLTRNGHDWTQRYHYLAKALEKLPCKSAVLDGEVVVQDPRGVTSLDLLEQALSAGDSHAMTYFAFDLVYLDGYDLSGTKLVDRKAALEGLIGPLIDARSQVQLSEHMEGDGQVMFAEASRMGLEGIVSKKADARYVQARSDSWLKVKRVEIASFVVIGFLSNMPRAASSLILAEERDGELAYACRVGSGISDEIARALYQALSPLELDAPVTPVPKTPGAHWVEPRYEIELGFRSRSRQNAPRAPVLLSWAARKPRKAPARMKPKLIGDRDRRHPPDQPRAGDIPRQRRHQAGHRAPLRPRRRLAAARGAAPPGDGGALPDRRAEGLLLPAPFLRRPAARNPDGRALRRRRPRRLHQHHRA